MSRFHSWQSGTALFSVLALTAGAAAPLVVQVPVQAQTTFSDVTPDYWAGQFIRELTTRGVIGGFPDGSFRPNDPVTRAQFAAMVSKAFNRGAVRQAVGFVDVPSNYWASNAIRSAYSSGFLSGYPGGVFRPDENIPRGQVLVSLSNGLGYVANKPISDVLQVYSDASSIPGWATASVAAATEKNIVVSYPDVRLLSPNRPATRAEVAAFIYQALVSSGQAAAVSSPYIVGQGTTVPMPTAIQIPAGTSIPVRYEAADKILLAPEEPQPVPVVLTISRDIAAQNGRVLIPSGSKVSGELRVVQEGKGAQFYASELTLPDRTRLPINATSSVVSETETVTKGVNPVNILAGTALGAGAAAGIAAVTGDHAIATEEVLGGGAAGALAGLFLGRNHVRLISIKPDTDLDMTLTAPLVFR